MYVSEYSNRAVFEVVQHRARDSPELGIVSQIVMLKILTSKSVPPNFTEGWLRQVVKNAAVDLFRDLERERLWIDRSLHVSGVSTVEEGSAEYVAAAVVVDFDKMIDLESDLETLDLLPAREKQVLILYIEGFSYIEIAQLTGANVGTVRSRLHSARVRARQLLACA